MFLSRNIQSIWDRASLRDRRYQWRWQARHRFRRKRVEAPGLGEAPLPDLLYTNNYIDDLSTLPLDVDGDGRVDLITSGGFQRTWPGGRIPAERRGVDGAAGRDTWPIEFTFLVDLDNDGKAHEILPQFGDTKMPLAWYEPGKGGLIKHVVSITATGTASAWAT